MPRIDETSDNSHGSTVQATSGFAGAFLQVSIHPDVTHKSAFHTRIRMRECTCKPFGLVNAPAKLQRKANLDFQRLSKRDGW